MGIYIYCSISFGHGRRVRSQCSYWGWGSLQSAFWPLAPLMTRLQRWNILVNFPPRHWTQFIVSFLHPISLL